MLVGRGMQESADASVGVLSLLNGESWRRGGHGYRVSRLLRRRAELSRWRLTTRRGPCLAHCPRAVMASGASRRSVRMGSGGDRRELFEDRAQLGVCVGSELLFDVPLDLGDDRARCGHQLLSAAGGVDALGAVVVGVGDALEVTALYEVVDQRFDRLLAHIGVGGDVYRALAIRTGPLKDREVTRAHVLKAGSNQLGVDASANRLPRRAQQNAEHR